MLGIAPHVSLATADDFWGSRSRRAEPFGPKGEYR